MRGRVEEKVKWSTAAAYIGSAVGMYAVELIAGDPVLVTPLPDVLEPVVLAILPGLLPLLAGLRAKHPPRHDLPIGNGRELGTRYHDGRAGYPPARPSCCSTPGAGAGRSARRRTGAGTSPAWSGRPGSPGSR